MKDSKLLDLFCIAVGVVNVGIAMESVGLALGLGCILVAMWPFKHA